MINKDQKPETTSILLGFTPTGSTKHIVESWLTDGQQRSVCNTLVRTEEQMLEQRLISTKGHGNDYEWCKKCVSWVEKMAYFKSKNVPIVAPVEIVDEAASILGIRYGAKLATVTSMEEWKARKGRS